MFYSLLTRPQARRSFVLYCALALVFCSSDLLADPAIIPSDDTGRWQHLGTEDLERVLVLDLPLADGDLVDLRLQRVHPFGDDARVRINGRDQGSIRSAHHYFRGNIVGQSDSTASLSVGPDGVVRGGLSGAHGSSILTNIDQVNQSRQVGPLRALFQSAERTRTGVGHNNFECGNRHVPEPLERPRQLPEQPRGVRNDDQYRVRVAFESDASFYNLFGNAEDAQRYLGDLINFISGIYERELNTELVISSISLWDSEDDQPWQNTDHPGPFCLMAEFGIFWNDPANEVDDERTIAHFVTANTGSASSRDGVAWRGTLCRGPDEFLPFDTGDSCTGFSGPRDDVIGDFGVSRGIAADYEIGNAPGTWDYNVVAHEIGHNFDSKHTHCYGIDQCFSGEGGCYVGPESLPGPSGEGAGTIMSYCFRLAGGLDNISPTFGRDHPWGDNPDQVPDIMRNHLVEQGQLHSINPRCPELIDPAPVHQLSVASTGASNVDIASTSGHGGVTNYTLTISEGSNIELSAPASADGNEFDGWSGCDSTSGTQCSVSAINSDVSVTVSYVSPQHTLSVNSTGVGNVQITSSPAGFAGTTNYSVSVGQGTSLVLTAPSSVDGLRFDGWSGCDSASGASCTISSIAGDRTVSVAYAPPPDDPEISVSPKTLSTSLGPDETIAMDLELANNGDGSLNWGIQTALARATEPERSAFQFGAESLSPLGHSGDESTRTAFSCGNPDSPGMLVNDDGFANFSWGFTPQDDFSVEIATFVEGFAIDSPGVLQRLCVALMAVEEERSEPFSLDVVVFDSNGPGGQPGSELLSGTVTFSGVAESPYWFSIDTSGAGLVIDSGVVYLGVRYRSVDERVSIMIDGTGPGGEGSYYDLDGRGWATVESVLSEHRALMIRGQLLSGCDAPSDIDWLEVDPASGSIDGGGRSTTAIRLDSSGLAQGNYEAVLCIQSNDPEQSLVQVPVSLEVTGPMIFRDRFEN